MNHSNKLYTWRIISSLKDGMEFHQSQCDIDWGLFLSYCKAICDANALWNFNESELDLIISEDKTKIKCIG